MRTIRKKYLSYLPIEESIYKADFQILDKYQSVSAEILRLSLVGLAVYGFILTNVIFKVSQGNIIQSLLNAFVDKKHLLTAGGVCLLLAAACSLAHRYFSTDSMSHHIRGIRLRAKWEELMKLAEAKGITIQPPEKTDYKKRELDLIPTHKLTDDQICFWIDYLREKMEDENDSLEADFDKCLLLFIGAAVTLIAGIGFALWGFTSFLAQIRLS